MRCRREVRSSLDGFEDSGQKQILPPGFVLREVLKEMTDFIGKPASENILATHSRTVPQDCQN